MKLSNVKILDAELLKGRRYWWVADLRYDGRCVEITQSISLGITRDDALAHARDFANRIGAELVEPTPRMDPCV